MAKNYTLKELKELEDQKREISLKHTKYENLTKNDINFLTRRGHVNGVGPEHYGKWIRWICTKLFGFLDFVRHDINFWKGGNEEDFERANWGLLKYSYLSMARHYITISKDTWYRKLYKLPIYYISLPFKDLVMHLSYNACSGKNGRKAFNFYK